MSGQAPTQPIHLVSYTGSTEQLQEDALTFSNDQISHVTPPQPGSLGKEGTRSSSISESSGSEREVCDQERFLRACEEEDITTMIELIESKEHTAVLASMNVSCKTPTSPTKSKKPPPK